MLIEKLYKTKTQAGAVTVCATLISILAQFIQIYLLTKIISPKIYGEYIFLSLIFSLMATYSDFGYSSSFYKKERLYFHTLRITVLRTCFVAFISMLMLVSIYYIFFLDRSTTEPIYYIWNAILSVVCSCLFVGYTVVTIYASNRGKYIEVSLAEMFGAIVFTITSIALASFNPYLDSLLIGLGLSLGTKYTICYLASKDQKTTSVDNIPYNEYYSYGVSAVGDRLINFASSNIDKIVISSIFGSYLLGIYGAQQQLAFRVFQIVAQIVSRIAPSYLDGSGNLSKEEVLKNFQKMQDILISFAQPAILFILINSNLIVGFVLGSEYSERVYVFQIMIIISYLYIIESHFGVALLKINGPKQSVVINAISFSGIGICLFSAVALSFEYFILLILLLEIFIRLTTHIIARKLLWSQSSLCFILLFFKVTFINTSLYGLMLAFGKIYKISDFDLLLISIFPLILGFSYGALRAVKANLEKA